MDYTVPGIPQARILVWVAFPFSRGSSQPRDQTQDSPHCRRILSQLSHREAQGPGETYPNSSALPEEADGLKGPLLVPKLWLLMEPS